MWLILVGLAIVAGVALVTVLLSPGRGRR